MADRLRLLIGVLLAVATRAAPVAAQVPAPCPQEVNPRVIGYPDGYIPFSEGGRSGNFGVEYLFLPIPGSLGPPKVTYLTMPDIPHDRDNPRMIWDLSAIDAVCTYEYYGPDPRDRIWAVHETWKYGFIFMDKEEMCDTEVATSLSDTSYDPYGSASGSDCGVDAGGGGGAGYGGVVCGGSETVVWDYVCVDIWVDGIGWVEWWCGVVAICS